MTLGQTLYTLAETDQAGNCYPIAEFYTFSTACRMYEYMTREHPSCVYSVYNSSKVDIDNPDGLTEQERDLL